MVRKKGLVPGTNYQFRIRAQTGAPATWGEFSEVSPSVGVLPMGTPRPASPSMYACDTQSITVQWSALDGAEVYELQWRPEAPGSRWIVASDKLGSTATRKKNLVAGEGYMFRVRARVQGEWLAFSAPSPVLRPGLSPALTKLLGNSLQNAKGNAVATADVAAGKVVAVYFSAHWCPPCRAFTPQLATFYSQMRAAGKPFEVIFMSSDQDEASYREYLSEMPWHALPFGSPLIQQASQSYGVNGIPRLIVLGPDGKLLCSDGRQAGLSAGVVDGWVRQAGLA